VIELTFQDEGMQVVAVSDGRQAIDRLRDERPDVVLADVTMPERDGYDVAAYVKDTPDLAHIPVVLMTGAFEQIDEARARAVGCDGVLAKPFEPHMAIALVRRLLAGDRPGLAVAYAGPCAAAGAAGASYRRRPVATSTTTSTGWTRRCRARRAEHRSQRPARSAPVRCRLRRGAGACGREGLDRRDCAGARQACRRVRRSSRRNSAKCRPSRPSVLAPRERWRFTCLRRRRSPTSSSRRSCGAWRNGCRSCATVAGQVLAVAERLVREEIDRKDA
jgi:CheY-like chemotaxis protein